MDSLYKVEGQEIKRKIINNGGSNMLTRVSIGFKRRLDSIDKNRRERELNKLSAPKITELIIRHKHWNKIEEDITNFLLDDEVEQ